MTKSIQKELDWFCYKPIDWQRSLGYIVKKGVTLHLKLWKG